MQISFYVLSDRYLTDDITALETQLESQITQQLESRAVLYFVCKLTQTVLKKSTQPLLILDDNQPRLRQLDEQLWSFEPTSFIPHQLISTLDSSNLSNPASISTPVLLSHELPSAFTGVVLNLASQPLPLTNQPPSRLLEIITPDEPSKQRGRDRYRHYRQLGFELNHFIL